MKEIFLLIGFLGAACGFGSMFNVSQALPWEWGMGMLGIALMILAWCYEPPTNRK